jgi:hypothetical protein
MAKYGLSINNVTASTTQDLKTLVTNATGAGSALLLHEASFQGGDSSSVFTRLVVNRPSAVGVTIGANTMVPEKFNPASVAAAFTVAGTTSAVSSWSTAPALSTNDVIVPAINTFGGEYRWVAMPGVEIVVGTQGAVANLSVRSRSGTGAISGHLVVEEL